MEKLVSNIQPTDELIQLQDDVLRFKNLETDTRCEMKTFFLFGYTYLISACLLSEF